MKADPSTVSSLSLLDRQSAIRSQNLQIHHILDACNNEIKNKHGLNAFITTATENAQIQTGIPDRKTAHGEFPLLSGCVLAVKDNIALKDVPLTCASSILEGYVSPYTATALQRLIDAGAIVIGKTNLDEFAMGSSGEHSRFGATLNPVDSTRVPGGSSSGSAVAVAAGMATAALGSDTGGSVRQPASFCGVLGLKPTYGRVSRYGLTAFASSMDQIGILTRHIDEMAAILSVISGSDPLDNTSSDKPVSRYNDLVTGKVNGLKIGIPHEYISGEIQAEIKEAIVSLICQLRDAGAEIKICSLPHTSLAVQVYQIIASAEASSNLARYDGVRYGRRAEGSTINEIFQKARTDGFGDEVKRRIMLGTFVLSSGYYNKYYGKAQRVRQMIRSDFKKAFDEFDLIICPTTPTTAFKIGEKISDPISMYMNDIFTVPANLAGIPAISCPFSVDKNGLPIGVQFMADHYKEDYLLNVAAYIEGIQYGRSE